MIVTCDWRAPIRTIILARAANLGLHKAAGHLFLYDSNGSAEGYAGEANALSAWAV
jgi:hypothetical protein